VNDRPPQGLVVLAYGRLVVVRLRDVRHHGLPRFKA
jgi:hypothetical protein